MANIRFKPKQNMTFNGRKVLQIICEENEDDRRERISRMVKASNHNRVYVIGRNIESGEERIYPSMTIAGKKLGICPSSISKACKNINRTAGGFKWKKL